MILITWSPVLAGDAGPSFESGTVDRAEVEAFFDEAVPAGLAKYNIPGATVSFVQDGELIFSRGYGYSDIENRTPVDPETTLFHIGSITKLFTWTCVMQLVEEGKIDLDADINTYLKDFSIPETYPGNPVTMRHLMTHSAGFEEQGIHGAVLDVEDLYPFRIYCKENVPARVYPPGTVTSYSNYGTTLAAVIVEDVTGVPYEQYLNEHILSPLSMTRTSISYTLPPEMARNLSSGYHYTGMANEAVVDMIYVIGPAGAISSTANDMAAFLAAHMKNGSWHGVEILSEETAALMHAPAFSNDPRVSGMCLGFYETRLNDERIIGHGGDTDTFHSLLAIIPERGTGFFVSYNSLGGGQARDDLLMEFVDRFYPASASIAPAKDSGTPAGKYTGTYQSTRQNYRTFEFYLSRPGQIRIEQGEKTLLFTSSGSPPSEYGEVTPGVFAQSSGQRTSYGNLVFHEDEQGTVDFFCYGNLPFFAFERVPWYATDPFTDGVKNAGLAILLTVLVWPIMAVFRRVYGVTGDERDTALSAYVRLVAGAASLLFVVFVLALLPAVMGDMALIESYMFGQTIPLVLSAVMTVPVIAVLLSAVAAAFAILVWRRRYWSVWHRVHYSIVVIGLFMLSWWVNFWNLFVFRL
ncbi:serine hydrolase domain-containing protein [Methanoculleus sediminis]|uniref:serine hydrolase domain-containing protein n=1 Tax=Methanoculleus sediminis TaxID=1550566 RepID=UPI00069B192C|nr:serine hydrolase domain-containing protein [Methanoculleus sediminis]